MSTTLPPGPEDFISLRGDGVASAQDARAGATAGATPSRSQLADDLRAGWSRLGRMRFETWVGLVIVAACVAFVFVATHPDLVFANTTPTGGDMGSHVWGPKYLSDHLLPHGRVSGWTPDWYAGFPAYQFYMVVPSLVIVGLATGFSNPFLAVIAVGAALAIAFSGFVRPDLHPRRNRWRWWLLALGAVVLVISLPIPYNISFKLIVISGLVTFPIAAYVFGRLCDLPFPTPPLLAVAGVLFLFNREPSYNGYANIIGGNFGSTMAGEFAFSISLTLAVVYLGVLVRGLRTGRHRGWAAALLALTVLCHLIPGLFALAATAAVFIVRPNLSRLKWLATTLPIGGLLAAFWFLPFFGNRQFMNDMGWEKLPALPPDVQDKFGSWFTTKTSNGVQFYGRWYYLAPPNLRWVLWLALAGLVLAVIRRRLIGVAFAVVGLLMAVAFVVMPEGRLWNTRLLPFLFLSCFFLAAIAVGELISLRGWLAPGFRPAPLPMVLVSTLVLALSAWALVAVPDSKSSGFERLRHLHLMPLVYLLFLATAGVAIAGIVYVVARAVGARAETDRLMRPAVALVMGLAGIAIVAFPLNKVPFAHRGADGIERWPSFGGDGGAQVVGQAYDAARVRNAAVPAHQPATPLALFDTGDTNAVSSWAEWNFGGLQRKQPWPEFSALIGTMGRLGGDPSHGCGRAMWEYDGTREGSYGTPMALMMFPYFTNGCIGSMEGLYFESSSTTPFHFINQTELSTQPSSSQRDLPYSGFDMERGVQHLQLLGVKYYLADTPAAIAAASRNTDLTAVAESGPWHVYQVADISLVTPLRYQPVVMDNVENQQDSWLGPAMDWYADPTKWDVPLAADGPKSWDRIKVTELPVPDRRAGDPAPKEGSLTQLPPLPQRSVRETQVTNVVQSDDGMSFDVDRPGSPVLVKMSYFPNFEASGAEGPWRVTPNLMVVIPTDRHVSIHYGRTGLDWLGLALTLLGIGLVVLLARRPALVMPAGRWWWTRDPDEPAPDGDAGWAEAEDDADPWPSDATHGWSDPSSLADADGIEGGRPGAEVGAADIPIQPPAHPPEVGEQDPGASPSGPPRP